MPRRGLIFCLPVAETEAIAAGALVLFGLVVEGNALNVVDSEDLQEGFGGFLAALGLKVLEGDVGGSDSVHRLLPVPLLVLVGDVEIGFGDFELPGDEQHPGHVHRDFNFVVLHCVSLLGLFGLFYHHHKYNYTHNEYFVNTLRGFF